MVALALLLVGVLALLVMIEGSLTSTSRTTAREQATNLAREIVERSREVPYASTTTDARGGGDRGDAAGDPGGRPAGQLRRPPAQRRPTRSPCHACSIDSPSDGAGVGDATFCDAPSTSTGPGSAPTGSGPRGRAERPRPARVARGRRQPRQHGLQRRRHRHRDPQLRVEPRHLAAAVARRQRRPAAALPRRQPADRSPSTPVPTTCGASACASTGRPAAAPPAR